jgi:hypothetical protein
MTPQLAPEDEPVRIGRFETLGAWLGVWTPPKGASLPPVPKRKLAAGAAAIAVVIAAFAVWLVPQIEHGKRSAANMERRAATLLSTREQRRLAQDQRLHEARGVPPRHSGASELTRRQVLVHELERSITLDARQRAAAGSLRGPVLATSCRSYSRGRRAPSARPSLTEPVGRYECVAVTSAIPRSARNVAGTLGYPFWARVDFRSYSYAWCKVNPPPGERGIGAATAAVGIPARCDLQRA